MRIAYLILKQCFALHTTNLWLASLEPRIDNNSNTPWILNSSTGFNEPELKGHMKEVSYPTVEPGNYTLNRASDIQQPTH